MCIISLVACFFWFYQNLKIAKNSQDITIIDPLIREDITLSIALIGDIHIFDTDAEYQKISNMLSDVKSNNPDLIIFAGDYTGSPDSVNNMNNHRLNVAELLTRNDKQKKIFVLGNYESWSEPEKWLEAFENTGAYILENDVLELIWKDQSICIRGLGDYYTRKFNYIDFPSECRKSIKFSVTHDPAGGFHRNMDGLILAGHTHCGQISFPFVGALWIPSTAPREATCGLYEDTKRTIFTTAGAGTTLLPIRIGTKSSWDLLSVKFTSKK